MSHDKSKPDGLDYSFACGGWLKMYLFGVAKALQEFELTQNSRFIGCSAGALAATGLALGCDFDLIKQHVVEEIMPEAHGDLSGAFKVRDYLKTTLRMHGKLSDFETLNAQQNLIVSYSALPSCTNRRESSFRSADHLESSLLASCCASPIAGLPFCHENEWIFDGGLTDFQPMFDANTVTVSPFYCTQADIRPSRYVPMWWAMYPPSIENIEWMFQLGYEDGYQWALRQGYIDEASSTKYSATLASRSGSNEHGKGAQKYDGDWSTSFGRFMGYKALENRLLDACFVFFVVLLWKPLAFFLVYIELCIRAVITLGQALVFSAACKLFVTLSLTSILSSTPLFLSGYASLMFILCSSVFFIWVVVSVGGMNQAATKAGEKWRVGLSCLRNLVSLSLFLRSVPGIGVVVPIKRHAFLLEHSLIYRLTNHFV